MIRDIIRSQPPRAWLADVLGLACVFAIVFAFTLAGLAVIP